MVLYPAAAKSSAQQTNRTMCAAPTIANTLSAAGCESIPQKSPETRKRLSARLKPYAARPTLPPNPLHRIGASLLPPHRWKQKRGDRARDARIGKTGETATTGQTVASEETAISDGAQRESAPAGPDISPTGGTGKFVGRASGEASVLFDLMA